uniref:Uncharacterized protein n=1 Tax=Sarcophilus harrisii TaxID=9305 RepID=A0A7N4PFM8_SARHA
GSIGNFKASFGKGMKLIVET